MDSGADVNACNCYGFSCLHEACHRGYADIVKSLLKVGDVDLAYIPPKEANFQSPFASAPPQSALGEAARCGFYKIVTILIDFGANKDQCNYLGWTALHEACFYHRIETVKTLLLSGANAASRTNKGALPYHLAGLQEIRSMLQDMGGVEAVPGADDLVDMVDILTELTLVNESAGVMALSNDGGHAAPVIIASGSRAMPMIMIASKPPASVQATLRGLDDQPQDLTAPTHPHRARAQHAHPPGDSKHADEEKLLHSGGVLGDLPSLSGLHKTSPNEFHSSHDDSSKAPPNAFIHNPSRRADDKNKRKKKHSVSSEVPADMPREFICQLTQRPMSDPVKTVYGNVYDRTAIMQWISTQGRICPLTGI